MPGQGPVKEQLGLPEMPQNRHPQCLRGSGTGRRDTCHSIQESGRASEGGPPTPGLAGLGPPGGHLPGPNCLPHLLPMSPPRRLFSQLHTLQAQCVHRSQVSGCLRLCLFEHLPFLSNCSKHSPEKPTFASLKTLTERFPRLFILSPSTLPFSLCIFHTLFSSGPVNSIIARARPAFSP